MYTHHVYQVEPGGITPYHRGSYADMRDAYARAIDIAMATGGRVMVLDNHFEASPSGVFTATPRGVVSGYGTPVTDRDAHLRKLGFVA